MGKLAKIQATLKAPKGQHNSFGKYDYRSCEDILEAVKPLLDGAILTISDEMVELGGRVYVKATATFIDGDSKFSTTAYAREQEERKGMDAAQITGAASSYARKYCLNGLFLIDDTKDADTSDNTAPAKPPVSKTEHWCKEHDTAFFKKGKMKSYAHPIGDTGEWCHEHKEEPIEAKTPPANGKAEECLQFIADKMKFSNAKTARKWLVDSMGIEEKRIDSNPEEVLKEIADLKGWNL